MTDQDVDILGTGLLQHLGRELDSVAGIDHIVDQDSGLR